MPRIRFYFPDGLELEMVAQTELVELDDGSPTFRALPMESEMSGEIPIIAGVPMVPDSRCLCADLESGEVLYNPRDHVERMSDEFQAFFSENPQWPLQQLEKALAEIRDAATGTV